MTPRPVPRRAVLRGTLAATALGAAAVACAPDRRSATPAAPPRRSPLPVPLGFAVGSTILWAGDVDVARTLDVVADSGATEVRFDVSWTYAEPSPGTFDWAPTDRVVRGATERGLRVLATLTNTPSWAAIGGSERHVTAPADAARFGAFATRVAQHYRDDIAAYEIWNEPNSAQFWEPRPDPAAYAALVGEAHRGITSVQPDALVVAGALATSNQRDLAIPAAEFVAGMYAAGVAGSFDALSAHPYDYGGTLADGVPYPTSPMQQLVALRALMDAHGDVDKALWITEYGVPSTAVPDDVAAALIGDCARQWPEVGGAGPFYVHTVRDTDSSSADPESRFGVVTDDYRPKPALGRLTALVAAGNPRRDVAALITDADRASLGRPLTPVFAVADSHAQQCALGTVFATPQGVLASPPPLAEAARALQVRPVAAAVAVGEGGAGAGGGGSQGGGGGASHSDGAYQDFAADGPLRIFTGPASGTRVLRGAVVSAWTPALGLPVSDEYVPPGADPAARAVDFASARIVWSPGLGATTQPR